MAAYTSAGYYDMDSGRWEVGDLDNSLLTPELSLDVHMSPDGQDFSCSCE